MLFPFIYKYYQNEGKDGITDKEVTTVNQNWVKTSLVTDLSFLSQDMKNFYQSYNFPLYNLLQLPDNIVPLISKASFDLCYFIPGIVIFQNKMYF